MSIQEIEQAIEELNSSEIAELADWIAKLRSPSSPKLVHTPVDNPAPITLAERMGDLLGGLGKESSQGVSSTRDAGATFTDYLATKKRDGHL